MSTETSMEILPESSQAPAKSLAPSTAAASFTTATKFSILVGLIVGFIATFGSGYYLSSQLQLENPPQATPTVSPSPTPDDFPGLLPGTSDDAAQQYFLDTIFLIEKAEPHRAVIASIGRKETDQGFLQDSRASYFNGAVWDREVTHVTTTQSGVEADTVIKKWDVKIDPSRVLREKVSGKLDIHTVQVEFTSDTLANEIGMRSLPDYTKFMSEGDGTILIDGTSIPVHILYTRIYSMDASKIQFYTEPMGVTTDWVAFWDQAGNFYHIDTTEVGQPTDIYETHQIGVWKNSVGTVAKTFQVSVARDPNPLPIEFTISLQSPISTTLRLERASLQDRSIAGKYDWFLGTATGTVTNSKGEDLQGFGIIEYIHDAEPVTQ